MSVPAWLAPTSSRERLRRGVGGWRRGRRRRRLVATGLLAAAVGTITFARRDLKGA